MPLVAAKCPECGASIQLPNERETSSCVYCGTSVRVEQAINLLVKSGPDIGTLLSLGKTALSAGENQQAYDYFSRATEADLNSFDAWVGKADASWGLATLQNMRIDEVKQCCSRALESSLGTEAIAISCCAILSKVGDGLTFAINDHFKKFGGTYIGPMGSMMAWVNETESTIWQGRILPVIDLHITAIEMARKHANSSLTEAIISLLNSLREFLNLGFMAEIRCVIRFTDGREMVRMESILTKMSENLLTHIGSLYEKFLGELKVADPKKEAAFPRGEDILEKQTQKAEAKSSMCFIATACYGSGDATSVMVLRAFRDEILKTFPLGKSLIGFYYRHSPPVASFLARHTHYKFAVRWIFCAPSVFIAKLVLAVKGMR